MTRYDFKCPLCKRIYEVKWSIAAPSTLLHECPTCRVQTRRYYGRTHSVPINFGFSESRGHGDIEKFQFTNL